MYDIAIIGGGVIGAFCAYTLASGQRSVVMIEKEAHTALHATSHNSALIHSPVSVGPEYGILKSTLAEQGNRLYDRLAPALGIPVLTNGALMLATDETEVERLTFYLNQARDRGLSGVKIIQGEELKVLEPHLADDVIAALTMPTAKTADTRALVDRLIEEAQAQGLRLELNHRITAIDYDGAVFHLISAEGLNVQARFVINAAGTFAAELAGLYETHVPYIMTPVRGEYLELDASVQGFVKHTLFPLPGPKGKGILAIPQPDGTLRLGPTATAQKDLTDALVTEDGMAQIKHRLSDILKDIPYDKVTRTYAGLRATTSHKDFYIQPSQKNPYFIHVAGIDSPGVTAAPAIAQYVLERFIKPLE